MSEWHQVSLGDISSQRKGINYKSEDYCNEGSGYPFITIKCFVKGGGYEPKGIKYFNGSFTKQDSLYPDDILFSVTDLTRAGDIVGSPLKVPNFGEERLALASMDCMKIIPSLDVCNKTFLYHRLMLSDIRRQMVAYSAGSTVLHLDTKQVPKMKIKIPKSLNEQRKIATVLETIDQTIEKTEALIEKYQQIKAGLMHDLFTRGITADGKLRPPREQAPELYQETLIGRIPKDWIFTTCSDVCERVIDCKNRTPPITPDGHPVIRTPNVRNGMFLDKELVYTDCSSYLVWTARGKPRVGDILITREAPVGEVCKIPERHHNACLGQRMMLYRTDQEKVDNDYFLYALQSSAIQCRLDLISGGSTVGHVRVGDIRDLWMYLPQSRKEQEKIAHSLNAASKNIEKETSILNKLVMCKTGLMHDLLTGKVPVNVDTTEAAHV